MSHKIAKKVRQLYSREIKREAAKTVAHWGEVIKPKPRWMPSFVYRWCMNVVLR